MERVLLDHDLSPTDRSTSLAQIEAEGNGRHTPQYDDGAWAKSIFPSAENSTPTYEDPGAAEK
jgi:hypothetical protein